MYKIYLCTDDDKLAKSIAKISDHAGVCRVGNLNELRDSGVVILSKVGNNHGRVPGGFVGVAPEDDCVALKLLSESRVPAVTCGFSPTASLTVSAVGEQSAAVCLQRHIRTLGGRIIEEGDITLKIAEGWDKTALMLWVAAELLAESGDSPTLLFDIAAQK